MRQLINSTYITLDGVVEGPHLWPALKRVPSDECNMIQTKLLEACGTVLLRRCRGRRAAGDKARELEGIGYSTVTLTDHATGGSEAALALLVHRLSGP